MVATPTFTPRTATRRRITGETEVEVTLLLDGTGRSSCQTGIGFLDHMLTLWARHSRFDLTVRCQGDLHVDEHHSVEDVAITLGQTFAEALGDKAYIARYGHAYVPMDDTLARVVVDLSGRFYFVFGADFDRPTVGQLATELVPHFWYAFAEQVRCNLHIQVLYGQNTHHKIEAIFKAVACALHEAVQRDLRFGPVRSTKGIL